MINISSGPGAGTHIFAPIKAHRTFETVIERIVEAIDAQGLQDGDRLPNEHEMARAMEISRPTLRQALRILENVGVIRIKPGQAGGVFIASEMIPVEILGHHIAHEVNHVAELIATRRLLEPLVYHLAAEHATAQELERIGDTITLMETHISDPRMIQRADGMFHRRIAHAAKNRILLQTMTGIYRQLAPLRGALTKNVERARHMIEIHTRLLDAIRARDHQNLELLLQETFIDLEVEFNVDSHFSVHWLKKDPRPSAEPPGQ
ncbi:FadR/GntR family transcriptional regulator [Sodalis sp. RH21]|uniref:FadR/GntR family transcriptional regulator n=1 Tax=unclassified Sodalis (in: enterobacteria) TaxID=2636512 RepID=UPI0039B44B98